MREEKELFLTPEGFNWFKCKNENCECVWQSCNDESECPECGSFNIELLEEEENEKQEDH